jgi:hypothetical protein
MDRRSFLVGATTAVGGFTLLGPTSGCAPAPIAGAGYQLVFEDDFDDLDMNVWQPEPWYQSVFDWSNVSVANSVLTLTANLAATAPRRDFTTLASIGPRAPSRPYHPLAQAWREGYFEIRARCTNDPWTKLALWFMSHESSNCWPEPRNCSIPNAEWDMVENGIRAAHAGSVAYADVNHVSVVHTNTSDTCGVPDEAIARWTDHPAGGLCDWHVWGGLWTATSFTSYLDGQPQVTQVTTTPIAQRMYMLLTAAPLGPLGASAPPKPDVIETQIDWVRVWQK